MVAAAVTFRQALEVWLAVGVVLSIVGGSARQHIRGLLVAIRAAFVHGSAVSAGPGALGTSLDTKAKAGYQASTKELRAPLMVWTVLTRPPRVRLDRPLAARLGGGRVRVVPFDSVVW